PVVETLERLVGRPLVLEDRPAAAAACGALEQEEVVSELLAQPGRACGVMAVEILDGKGLERRAAAHGAFTDVLDRLGLLCGGDSHSQGNASGKGVSGTGYLGGRARPR